MKKEIEQFFPAARTEGLVVQELSGEVLVYDRDRHKAHCLNRTAALVWNQCDGNKTVSQIARALREEIGQTVEEDVVWMGVEQLGKSHLLREQVLLPQDKLGVSRREVMRRLGLAAAIALPVVTSIVAPTAAQAANCLPSGTVCTSSAQCCSGLCSGGLCT